MATTEVAALEVPSAADYQKISDLAGDLLEGIQLLVEFKLLRLDETANDDGEHCGAVTFSDIGRLFTFTEHMRLDIENLQQALANIDRINRNLYSFTQNAPRYE